MMLQMAARVLIPSLASRSDPSLTAFLAYPITHLFVWFDSLARKTRLQIQLLIARPLYLWQNQHPVTLNESLNLSESLVDVVIGLPQRIIVSAQ